MAPALQDFDPLSWPLAPGWRATVDTFFLSPQGRTLTERLRARLAAGAVIYPPKPLNALALTALADVKVLILGQDPYHGPGQAHGLAFSVPAGTPAPPSLRNMVQELVRDPALQVSRAGFRGELTGWAAQGVLLLNTCLTVEQGRPLSHAQLGWQGLTDALIDAVAGRGQPLVAMLWGSHAQAHAAALQARARNAGSPLRILCANHPSPLSALRPPHPFIGCGHFSAANRFLQENNQSAIDWGAFACQDVWQTQNMVA
ncbi:MAG: uracil-DNA glycosylase [Rhodoferax sp.]